MLRALGVGAGGLPPPEAAAMHAHVWQRLVLLEEALLLMRVIAFTPGVSAPFLACLVFAPSCIQQLQVSLLRLRSLRERVPLFYASAAAGPLAPPPLAPWAVQARAALSTRAGAEMSVTAIAAGGGVCSVAGVRKLAEWWLKQVTRWRAPEK